MAGVNPGDISQSKYLHHLGPRMDGTVGKIYQAYNFLPPCQEINISCHKLSQIDNFSVHENNRTCRPFPIARPKCLMRDFKNLNRIDKPIGQMSDEPWKIFVNTVILWVNIQVWSPPSWNSVFWDRMTQIFQLTPISDPGPQSSWASTWQIHAWIYSTGSPWLCLQCEPCNAISM